ncbi:HNH endonuclease [Halopelagius longus]|uniref:5-methylcytosine-specific restriction enzyme A n=1 Tax=Halopelagius longus TaxID=1236180 RepID=A0A1H1AD86_9EURY|nr:HNH endonuclease signature motif containing protein [Halopelagius longus]RDI70332.1 HNH endonuclease [Halopelagius longus]SDQ37540.1 5-methylcytosine-specific restriction enzyme A [Halopelagius longus]
MKISDVPGKPQFEVGRQYLRKELHDQFQGQRQHGISTPSSKSFIFIFTDPASEEHGYSDRFLENGHFVYSGEGRVGDMTFDGGNERILNHKENGDSLFVFEKVDEHNGADVVTYDGEYEYIDHYWERAPDDNDEMRDAIRFKLTPLGGLDPGINKSEAANLSREDLFKRARESTQEVPTSTKPGARTSYTRSDLVRDFALKMADGVCQACNEEAPFVSNGGKPFLEVHHLYRVSDGGVDDPENVIAICPNCHREVHHGQYGDQLNDRLIENAKMRNQRIQP